MRFTKFYKMTKTNKKKHLIKALTWNVLAMTTTYFVLTLFPPLIDLKPISKEGATGLVVLDRIIKFVFYYLHERAWFKIN